VDPAKTAEMSSPRARRTLLLVGCGSFLTALGSGLVNVANPSLARALTLPLEQAAWVLSVFLYSVSVALPIAGHLGDRHGYRRLFVCGAAIFGAAALLCGLASSLPALLAARALQGLGAAAIMATGPALLTSVFPAARRGRALGTQGTLTYAGLSAGPAVGGLLAAQLGWRSVFLVLAPAALLLALAARLTLAPAPAGRRRGAPERLPAARRAAAAPPPAGPRGDAAPAGTSSNALPAQAGRERQRSAAAPPLDIRGALLVAAFLATVLLALGAGGSQPSLAWAMVVPLTGAALLGHLRRTPHPLFEIDLLVAPGLSIHLLAAYLHYATTFTVVFLLPFLLQDSWRLSADKVGLLLTVHPLAMALTARAGGILADRVGTRPPAITGMLLLVAGLALTAGSALLDSPPAMMAALAMLGLGSGLFVAPNTSAALGQVSPSRRGAAAALLALTRNLGMVSGVTLGGGLFALFARTASPPVALVAVLTCAALLPATSVVLLLLHRARPH
jgi:MFS family permease